MDNEQDAVAGPVNTDRFAAVLHPWVTDDRSVRRRQMSALLRALVAEGAKR